jgi:hypothetical protein
MDGRPPGGFDIVMDWTEADTEFLLRFAALDHEADLHGLGSAQLESKRAQLSDCVTDVLLYLLKAHPEIVRVSVRGSLVLAQLREPVQPHAAQVVLDTLRAASQPLAWGVVGRFTLAPSGAYSDASLVDYSQLAAIGRLVRRAHPAI